MTDDFLGDPGLLQAFWRYEQALITNDTATLDELFSRTEPVVRSDGGGVLVGHAAITQFRLARTAIPDRVVRALQLRSVADGVAMLIAESVRADGALGVQTQLWQREPDGWRIGVAHVAVMRETPVAHTIDRHDPRIWRTPPGATPLVAGKPAGSLDGMTIAVKDLFAVRGERIGAGNPVWLAAAPIETTNAPCIDRLITAGGDVVGIAHTDELAFSLAGTNRHYGTPPNPRAVGRITGGSSSGPASAVAAAMCDIGLGTDTAGSIRVPASYCGLYGLRTTHDAISRTGLVGLAPSFDTVGLLARDPAKLVLAADCLLAPATTPVAVRRVLIVPELFDLAEPGAAAVVTGALRALVGRRELTTETVSLSRDELESWFVAFRVVQQAEAWSMHGDFVSAHSDSLAPEIAERFRLGAATPADDVQAARDVLTEARQRLCELLAEDAVLALPTTSSPAPPVDAPDEQVAQIRAATLRLTCLASLAGLPQLAIPALNAGAAPVGLGLIGAANHDRHLLTLIAPDSLPEEA